MGNSERVGEQRKEKTEEKWESRLLEVPHLPMRLRPRVERAMSAFLPIFLGRLITTDEKLSVNAHLEKTSI